MNKERPTELWIVIFIILMVVIANIVLLRYYLLHPDSSYQIAPYVSLLWAAMGIIMICSLYKGYSWAWYITIVTIYLIIIEGIYNFIFVTFIQNIFGLFLAFMSLYLMYRPNVRKFFKK